MTFINTVSPDEASDEVAGMCRRQQDTWGFVPNFAKAFSHRPELMARWAALLAEVKRPLDERRLELVTFSAAHEVGRSALADRPMGDLPAPLRDALAVGCPIDTLPPVSLPA